MSTAMAASATFLAPSTVRLARTRGVGMHYILNCIYIYCFINICSERVCVVCECVWCERENKRGKGQRGQRGRTAESVPVCASEMETGVEREAGVGRGGRGGVGREKGGTARREGRRHAAGGSVRRRVL